MDDSSSVPSVPALGPWAPPSPTGPLVRKYLPGFPNTLDLCEGNKIKLVLKSYFTTASWGSLEKKKNPGALGTCPVCPLVKTALLIVVTTRRRRPPSSASPRPAPLGLERQTDRREIDFHSPPANRCPLSSPLVYHRCRRRLVSFLSSSAGV